MPFLLEFVEFQVLQCWLDSCEEHAGMQHVCTPKNTEAPGRHTKYYMLIKNDNSNKHYNFRKVDKFTSMVKYCQINEIRYKLKGKGKEYHTPWTVLVGCSSPLLRPWAHRWISHLSLWRMASAMPDLWLPSPSQDIAARWLVPNYTAWWQRHMCVNNLLKVKKTWQLLGQELNSRPLKSPANTLKGHSGAD